MIRTRGEEKKEAGPVNFVVSFILLVYVKYLNKNGNKYVKWIDLFFSITDVTGKPVFKMN